MDYKRARLIKDKIMAKSILLTFILAVSLTACGGSSGKEGGLAGSSSNTDNAENLENSITISGSNQRLEAIPTPDQHIVVTGNNNLLYVTATPKSVRLKGNDNTIYISDTSKVRDTGSGNVIIDLDGTGQNLN